MGTEDKPTDGLPANSPGIAPSGLEDPRVYLAAERTLLAWIRTGLAMMGFGFVVARSGVFLAEILAMKQDGVVPTPTLSLWIGGAMIMLGALSNFLAGVEHVRFVRQLPPQAAISPPRLVMSVTSAMVLGVLGIMMIGYLAWL